MVQGPRRQALSFLQLYSQYLAYAWHVLSIWQFPNDRFMDAMEPAILVRDPCGYSKPLWQQLHLEGSLWPGNRAKPPAPPTRQPQLDLTVTRFSVTCKLAIQKLWPDVGTKRTAVGQPCIYQVWSKTHRSIIFITWPLLPNPMWASNIPRQSGKRLEGSQQHFLFELQSALKV